MTDARGRLLAQIFAVLGVSSVACGKGSVVTPDKPGDDAAACPAEKGHYAEWPDGKRPESMSGASDVCLAKPANGDCSSVKNACVLRAYACGVSHGGMKVLDKLPTKEPDTCCWKVEGHCAVGRPFIVAGTARLAPLATGNAWSLATPRTAPAQRGLTTRSGPRSLAAAAADVAATRLAASGSRSLADAADAASGLATRSGPRSLADAAADVAASRLADASALRCVAGIAAQLDPATRAAIADVWARDGLTEHASVASFAQLVLELLAHGAPADLVLGAQQAMGDEIRHAERAFSLASLYAGGDVAPGALDTRGVGALPIDLADFAARTASEGCIAESIAALQLHAAADAATDPALSSLIRTTAEEESIHALLAYSIVAWAIAKGGDEVRVAVKAVFDSAAKHVGFGPTPDETVNADLLRSHGILPRRARHDLAVIALREVIAPAAEAVLRGTAIRAPRTT